MAKRFMVIYRNPFMRKLLEQALNQLGHEVTSKLAPGDAKKTEGIVSFVTNEFVINEEVVPAYLQQKPDAVLMDSYGGDLLTAKILDADCNAVIIGCAVELLPKANPSGYEKERKKLLDAGVKANVGLNHFNIPQFTEDLKKALDEVL